MGRVKTAAYLLNIGIIQNDEQAVCRLSNSDIETLDHLLLQCFHVWTVWSNLLEWWGVQWVTPRSMVDLLVWWKNWNLKPAKKIIWDCIPLAIMWTIWTKRNALVFDNVILNGRKSQSS